MPVLEGAEPGTSLDDLLGDDLEGHSFVLASARPHHELDQTADVLGRWNEEKTLAALDLGTASTSKQVLGLVKLGLVTLHEVFLIICSWNCSFNF